MHTNSYSVNENIWTLTGWDNIYRVGEFNLMWWLKNTHSFYSRVRFALPLGTWDVLPCTRGFASLTLSGFFQFAFHCTRGFASLPLSAFKPMNFRLRLKYLNSNIYNGQTLTDRVVKCSNYLENNCLNLYSRVRFAHPFGSLAIEFQATPEIYDDTRR